MTKPTVGRIVWFWLDRRQAEPLAAVITDVRNGNQVDLCVLPRVERLQNLYSNVTFFNDSNSSLGFENPFCMAMPAAQALALQSEGALALAALYAAGKEVSGATLPTNASVHAPRVTPEQVEDLVLSESFYHFPNTTVVVCCLQLKNGFSVVAEAACVSPENFDYTVGCHWARKKAIDRIWELEGYRLKTSGQ